MKKLDSYLTNLQENFSVGDKLKCDICGREVTIDKAGKGPLVCCDKPMHKISQISEAGFEKNPKGWDQSSIKKYSSTFTDKMKGGVKSKGFFDKCIKKMKGKMENPEGFCASLKDEAYGSTHWRGKGKTPSEVSKDTKSHQNVD